MSYDIQSIVDRLNQHGFEQLSLVTFDEKSPFELLQTLNDVFSALNKEHSKDLRDESQEQSIGRFIDFLWVLNYKSSLPEDQFRQGLTQGDRAVIYPILHWCLQRMPELQKRAYLARFLVNIDVPEEMFADDEVVQVFQQYKELQHQFKETHKVVDKMRTTRMEPGEIKREITQLEEEKEQLIHKISKIKTRVQGVENFEALFEVTSALRREQEDEFKLADSLVEQQQLLKQSDARHRRTVDQYKDAKNSQVQESAAKLLDKLETEVKVNKSRLEEGIVKDIRDKHERLTNIQQLQSMPSVSQNDVNALQQTIRQLNNEISLLMDKQAKMNNPADDKLAMFRQQATLVAKKKSEKSDRLRIVEEERAQLKAELREREDQCEDGKGSQLLKGEEFKKYVSSLRTKTNSYKKMKAELSELRAEWGVLNRTMEILKSRDGNLKEFLEDLEKKRGVRGYVETQDNLEKVSAAKSGLDDEKGKTLEEISRVVTEINNSIKDRKSKLAPQIKELRAVRAKFQELENEYMEKKQVYDNTKVGYETERSKLETEVAAYREETNREESRYHYLHCLSDMANVSLNRVTQESQANNSNFQSWKQVYAAKIQQQENLSKALREQQKQCKESHEPNIRQRAQFADLRKILDCKLRTYQSMYNEQNQGAKQGHVENTGDPDVNRLVIS